MCTLSLKWPGVFWELVLFIYLLQPWVAVLFSGLSLWQFRRDTDSSYMDIFGLCCGFWIISTHAFPVGWLFWFLAAIVCVLLGFLPLLLLVSDIWNLSILPGLDPCHPGFVLVLVGQAPLSLWLLWILILGKWLVRVCSPFDGFNWRWVWGFLCFLCVHNFPRLLPVSLPFRSIAYGCMAAICQT